MKSGAPDKSTGASLFEVRGAKSTVSVVRLLKNVGFTETFVTGMGAPDIRIVSVLLLLVVIIL